MQADTTMITELTRTSWHESTDRSSMSGWPLAPPRDCLLSSLKRLTLAKLDLESLLSTLSVLKSSLLLSFSNFRLLLLPLWRLLSYLASFCICLRFYTLLSCNILSLLLCLAFALYFKQVGFNRSTFTGIFSFFSTYSAHWGFNLRSFSGPRLM